MRKSVQTLTASEANKLLTAFDHRGGTLLKCINATRNFCMAVLMLDAGLRIGELTSLLIYDLVFHGEPVNTLTVAAGISKSKEDRRIPLSSRCKAAIEEMQRHVWLPDSEKMNWFAFHCSNQRKAITTRQVERIIGTASEMSLGYRIHPHILRHTFATNLMRVTSLPVVQELLGHKHITSTQVYTHPNGDDLTDAINSMQNVKKGVSP